MHRSPFVDSSGDERPPLALLFGAIGVSIFLPNGDDNNELLAPASCLQLPRPALAASRATVPMYLAPVMKTLAQRLAPLRIIVDCGGAGQCGPNTFSYLLGLAQLADVDGPQLRATIAAHVG